MKYLLTIVWLLGLLAFAGCSDEDIIDPGPIRDDVIHVPAEAPTIQEALDSAGIGDTVLVAPGIYSGHGNRDILFPERRIVLMSEKGPDSTVIDVLGTQEDPHFGIDMVRTPAGAKVQGFTIRNAVNSQAGAINIHECSPVISQCVFTGNATTVSGGAIRCKGASPRFVNCSFIGNASVFGGAVHLMAGSTPEFEQCLFVGNGGGTFGSNSETTDIPTLTCSNLFGNQGGDWIGNIAAQSDERGNFSEDPQFCSPTDYHLRPGSPCIPATSPCGKLVGALDVGCE